MHTIISIIILLSLYDYYCTPYNDHATLRRDVDEKYHTSYEHQTVLPAIHHQKLLPLLLLLLLLVHSQSKLEVVKPLFLPILCVEIAFDAQLFLRRSKI